MDQRSAPFAAGPLPAAGRPRAAALEEALRVAYAAGKAAHAGLDVPYEAFAEHVAARHEHAAASVARAAQGDLYLAAACETAAPGAWESFTGIYRGRLEGLLLARGVGKTDAEALAADLLADLALPPPRQGARTLLGTYDGSGSLFGWLAVILARRRTAAAARATAPLSTEPARDPAVAPGPLDALLEGETEREVDAGFGRAWASLTDRERLVLALRHRHGTKQGDIAALLGIGAPRVSRLLDGAVAKIRRALRGLSSARFGAGEGLWTALRDAAARHLARIEASSTPPRAAEDRKGSP